MRDVKKEKKKHYAKLKMDILAEAENENDNN